MPSDELASLVRAAQAGRRNRETDVLAYDAFATLVRRFEGMATATAFRALGDANDARDAVQDAFLDAWLKLPQLKDPRAVGAWIKRLVITHCARRRRKERIPVDVGDERSHQTQHDEYEMAEERAMLVGALKKLSSAQQRVLVQHYVFGRTLDEISSEAGVPRGTVGKRLHDARLKIRRHLPPAVRAYFITTQPSRNFSRRVSRGEFDDCVGTYRFAKRPDLVVKVVRERNRLVCYSANQRNVIAERRNGMLVAGEFDGEAKWMHDANGHVTGFVYYEFGKRLGVASKLHESDTTTSEE